MADIDDINSAQTVKLVGSDPTGVEQTPVQSTASGGLFTNLRNNAGSELGVLANPLITSSAAPTDLTGTGNIVALNGVVSAATAGRSSITFDVSGTWSATLIIEATTNGTDWFSIMGMNSSSGLALTSFIANQKILIHCGGYAQVRLRASAFTSGTAVITFNASTGVNLEDPTYSNNNSTAPSQSQLVAGIDAGSISRPLLVDTQGRLVTSAITGFGANFTFGDITTAALTQVPVRRTAYTEQSVNAQRSIASASASDAAAGTGARTVRITYLDATGAGPFTEILTLNGTTFVNTVATNICFIEKMEVVTVGSTGSNVGILTLRAAAAGGGVVIGTIAATNNTTFWAHHYVPTGKVCNITGVSVSHNGTTVGSGAVFILRAQSLPVAVAANIQVSDFVRLYGQASTSTRNYGSPIKVNGPARITALVTPESASSFVYRASIDFFEP